MLGSISCDVLWMHSFSLKWCHFKKYLGPFVFNHGCLHSRIVFIHLFLSLFLTEEMKASQQSASSNKWKHSRKIPAHITKHELLSKRSLLWLLWVIRVQRPVKELNDRWNQTELAHSLSLILIYFFNNSDLYKCAMSYFKCRMRWLIFYCAYSTSPMAPLIWIHLVSILPNYTGLRCHPVACEVLCILKLTQVIKLEYMFKYSMVHKVLNFHLKCSHKQGFYWCLLNSKSWICQRTAPSFLVHKSQNTRGGFQVTS